MRLPKGMGSYTLLKDGRLRWRQTKNKKTREIYAHSKPELIEEIKKVLYKSITNSKTTVDEYFQTWLNLVGKLNKTATHDQYSVIYNTHIKPVIGHYKLAKITQPDIQDVIVTMADKKPVKQTKKDQLEKKAITYFYLSTNTMKRAKSIMNIVFKEALKSGLISSNPVDGTIVPDRQRKRQKVIAATELNKLFEYLSDTRWAYAVCFLLYIGIRRGELLGLKWEDIDTINKRIFIHQAVSSDGSLGDLKSNNPHWVQLPKLAIEMLNKQESMLKKEFNLTLQPFVEGEENITYGYIFPNESGGLMHGSSFTTMFKRACKKVGIDYSPHCLRHTFVYLTRDILSLKDLQFALGHSSGTFTNEIYGNIRNQKEENRININEIFENLKDTKVNKDNIIDFKIK